MMSSIKKRQDGKWRARYRDVAGREHAQHFDRKVDGQQWLDEVTASIVVGNYIDPAAAKVTLAKYVEMWQPLQVAKPGYLRIIDNALRVHILPALGPIPVQALRPSHVQKLVKTLSMTHSAGHVRNVYDVLARVCSAAVNDRIASSSPCVNIKLPSLGDSKVVPPTPDQVVALVGAVPDRYRALPVLLAGSGLRIGEALGLDPADVRFLARQGAISVERQRLQSGDLATTKTDESRVVPVGEVVIEELAAHLARYPTDGPLFTASKGQPLRYSTWKAVWSAAQRSVTGRGSTWTARYLDKAGDEHRAVHSSRAGAWEWLDARPGLDLGTHSLRHYFASGLISGGASVKQVQEALGHSSPAITLGIYAHLWPGDEDRVRTISDANLQLLRTPCGLRAV